jgi:hypothetical protein
MVKDTHTVIELVPASASNRNAHPILTSSYREFNELVNMNADELKEWLKGDDSSSSGWQRDDNSGETIGHERYASLQS